MSGELLFLAQLMVSGLVVGSIYALVALGFVLIYKSTSILNLAQGEFLMFGAYICLSLTVQMELPFFWSFVMTLFFSVALGMAVEKLVLRPLIGEPIISVIMVTIGLSSVLRGLMIMIWGNDTRVYPQVFPMTPLEIGGVVVAQVYVWSFMLALALVGMFALFFKHSRLGIFMRATADDQMVAQSMGISVKRVFAAAWSIAAVVSSIGGVLIGNINGVNIELGHFGLKVLPAVIFGGLDSIAGAVIGGLTIGLLENLSGGYLEPFIPAVKEVAPFFILVLVLMVKPYGLFGTHEIERV